MRKNLVYLIIVIILLGILYFLKSSRESSNFSDSDFRVENIDKIGSIEIKDKYGNTTKLIEKDGFWTVTNGYPAHKEKIKILLETLEKLQIDFPVSDTLRPVAIENLRQYGIEVKIKDKDGDEIKTIFVGGQYHEGNYMILSENGIVSPHPYVVKIPGFRGDLKFRFLAVTSMWKSTAIFATPIDKIKTISVKHHTHPEFSFELNKEDDIVKIDPMIDSVTITRKLDQNKVVQFLLEFENKHFETWLDADTIVNEIKTKQPYITITLIDINNSKKSVVFYRKPPSLKYDIQTDAKGSPLPFDLDKYWSYLPESKEYVLTQHYVFGPVMETYDYFFENEKK